MEYKKSYKGLVWWLVLMFALTVAAAFLPIRDGDLMTRISLNVMGFLLVALMFIIYKAEAVYWINGVTFEEAEEAGSERRKRFALRHLERFGWFALLYLLFSVGAQLTGIGMGYDAALWAIGLIVTAVCTIPIKL